MAGWWVGRLRRQCAWTWAAVLFEFGGSSEFAGTGRLVHWLSLLIGLSTLARPVRRMSEKNLRVERTEFYSTGGSAYMVQVMERERMGNPGQQPADYEEQRRRGRYFLGSGSKAGKVTSCRGASARARVPAHAYEPLSCPVHSCAPGVV